MTRIVERLDDKRPLLAAILADPPDTALLARYRGTELVDCAAECTRAVIATGPLDIDLTLELVDDEGWSYRAPYHYCPDHPDSPARPMRGLPLDEAQLTQPE